MTDTEVTDNDIRALSGAAAEAGDIAMVRITLDTEERAWVYEALQRLTAYMSACDWESAAIVARDMADEINSHREIEGREP